MIDYLKVSLSEWVGFINFVIVRHKFYTVKHLSVFFLQKASKQEDDAPAAPEDEDEPMDDADDGKPDAEMTEEEPAKAAEPEDDGEVKVKGKRKNEGGHHFRRISVRFTSWAMTTRSCFFI